MGFFRVKKERIVIWLRFLILLTGIGVLFIPNFQTLKTPIIHVGDIVVDYTTAIRKLDPMAIGMDISGYGYPNVFVNDRKEQQRLKALGIKNMRMDLKYTTPGDPRSTIVCGGNGCDTQWTGDQWVQTIKLNGATPTIIVANNAVDAANMVKHFNKETNNYVQYWIIGNEPDLAGIPATTYSANFNDCYDAMKAVDPTIKIGGAATAWYDTAFLRTFLQLAGNRVDFIDFHGYAQKGDTIGDYEKLFQNASAYGSDITNLRSLIQSIVPARATHIAIEVGEWELNWGGNAQNDINFHTVWAASALGHILYAGGRSLFYADKGNALYERQHTVVDLYGHTIKINVDDPNPAYHGIGMFTGEGLFRGFGDTVVNTTVKIPDLEVYASDNPKNIVVVNKDSAVTQSATVSLNGVLSGTIEVWRKDESVLFPDPPTKLETITVQNGTFTYQFTPFSVTTFVLNGA